MSQTNFILSEEELSLVNDCAARLRVIQGDAAAIDAGKRREYLSEEVSRSFKVLPPGRRKPCLDSLLSRFPVAGQLANASSPPPAEPVAAAPESPEILLERLLAVAGQLSAAERAQFGLRLADAGLTAAHRETVPFEISKEALSRFGLPADRQPDLERVGLLSALVVQSLSDLDRTAISVLKDLYPRSSFLNRPRDFKQTTGQYLTGEIDKIEPHLRTTSTLLGGMLAAMLGGGRDFGRQFVEKFAPAAIEEVVIAEGRSGFMGPNKKERCWEKYCSLSKDIATADLMDRWLKECLGRFVDSGIKNVR